MNNIPGRRMEAIPVRAVATAIFPLFLTCSSRVDSKKVLPVPPGASIAKTPPTPESRASLIELKTYLDSYNILKIV